MNAQSNEGPAPIYVVVSPGPNMPPNQGTQPASGPQNMNNMASQQSILQKFPFDVLKSVSIEVTLVLSILVTLFGFLPTGVVALVFSLLSLSEYKTGNMAKAKEYCNIAQIWIVITVIVCILLWFTIIIMFIMTFLFFKKSYDDSIPRINARWALQQGDTAEVKVTLNRMMFLTILYLLSSINNLFEVLMPCPS